MPEPTLRCALVRGFALTAAPGTGHAHAILGTRARIAPPSALVPQVTRATCRANAAQTDCPALAMRASSLRIVGRNARSLASATATPRGRVPTGPQGTGSAPALAPGGSALAVTKNARGVLITFAVDMGRAPMELAARANAVATLDTTGRTAAPRASPAQRTRATCTANASTEPPETVRAHASRIPAVGSGGAICAPTVCLTGLAAHAWTAARPATTTAPATMGWPAMGGALACRAPGAPGARTSAQAGSPPPATCTAPATMAAAALVTAPVSLTTTVSPVYPAQASTVMQAPAQATGRAQMEPVAAGIAHVIWAGGPLSVPFNALVKAHVQGTEPVMSSPSAPAKPTTTVMIAPRHAQGLLQMG
mmetsp:Transcript_94937/g.163790  ORF Transcript_94937/g.163790 Transcript_94937/m.163790 type:complete len:365 (-) Transcript_94937:10608-11702(-)